MPLQSGETARSAAIGPSGGAPWPAGVRGRSGADEPRAVRTGVVSRARTCAAPATRPRTRTTPAAREREDARAATTMTPAADGAGVVAADGANATVEPASPRLRVAVTTTTEATSRTTTMAEAAVVAVAVAVAVAAEAKAEAARAAAAATAAEGETTTDAACADAVGRHGEDIGLPPARRPARTIG